LAPMIRRSGVPIASTATKLARQPPSRNSSRKRHGPITRSAGRPKISRNTRLPSRWAQSACRNRPVNRRSQCSPSAQERRMSSGSWPPLSAPHSSSSARCWPPGRVLAHRKASHSTATRVGVAQRNCWRWREGMETNMRASVAMGRAKIPARPPGAATVAGACARYHTPRYSASGVVSREGASGRDGQGGGHRPCRAAHPKNLPTERDPAMHTHPRLIQISALALGIAGAMAFSQAHAAAFLLKENSVKAQGRSMAGAASAKGDASVVANNPAVMSTFDKNTFQADVTAIDLSFKFNGGGSAAAGSPLAQPLTGGNGGDAGGLNVVPAMSFIKPLSGQFEYVTLGAMISAPFGLKTEYDDNWAGRYHAIDSDVKIIDLTLAASLDLSDSFSIGAGLIYEHSDVTLSNAIDCGSGICA